MSEVIKFYQQDGAYGFMSNFSRHQITIDGRVWPTTEHYFQARKFVGTEHEEVIRQAPSARAAAKMGRERTRPLRPDWEEVKDEIMREALKAKFTQHHDLRQALLATGDAELVEHTQNDNYWADGGDGSGRNMLGKLLMAIRAELSIAALDAP